MLRIALIAPSRYPVIEPFVGGLEAHVWLLASTLRARGHLVTLFSAAGSDPAVAHWQHNLRPIQVVAGERRDLSSNPRLVRSEDHAYRSLMVELIGGRSGEFDVIHNHSLHHLPISMAHRVSAPVVSTLHTPPILAIERALLKPRSRQPHFVAVSRHTADSWRKLALRTAMPVGVVRNGVDIDRWSPGPGGGPLIWSGRLVEEKGAAQAIDAARLAGLAIELAGPIVDPDYFRLQIEPRLGPAVRYLGHLDQRSLALVVGAASAALVTPRWDEPYGLVVAEALACGTPVAAFARGGIPEILTAECGRLATADDLAGLAQAAKEAVTLSRTAARRRAVEQCSARVMVEQYEAIYLDRIAATAGSR